MTQPDGTTASTPPTSSASPSPSSLVPHWVKEIAYIAGFVITMTVSIQTIKSDLRSNRESDEAFKADTRERITQMAQDLATIRGSIPNKEASELRIRQLESRIDGLESDLKFEAAKSQSMRERLIKKGWVD